MAERFSYDYVYNYFKENGCELLSKEYINNCTLLDYICECGNQSKIKFNDFKNGVRCNICGYKKRSITQRKPYEEVEELFSKNNCKLSTTKEDYYNGNSKQKLKYICSCGNEHEITYSSFYTGRRCNNCSEERKKQTNLKKFNVNYPLQNKDINKKARKTMFKNNSAPCSKQQEFISQCLDGELNYPVDSCSLDIAFLKEKIYIEYDGGGHDLSVRLGDVTEKEFKEKEYKRRYYLKSLGWKEIKIISLKDKIPSKEKIVEIFKISKELFLKNFNWIVFDIDNLNLRFKNKTIAFDYGELIKI